MNNNFNDNFPSSDEERKKVKLKGMTLMEVIIAMVVLVILAGLVAECASGILTNLRTSKSVVEKVNYQSDFVTARSGAATGGSVSFKLVDKDGKDIVEDESSITANIFEAPVNSSGKYAGYDKAGNLKWFIP